MPTVAKFKVYDSDNEYLATFKYAEDAAILVAAKDDGTTIRLNRTRASIVWTEGVDGSAMTSYSDVVSMVYDRMKDIRGRIKTHGQENG